MDDEPNLYMGNTCFTKHPLKIGGLGFQVYTLNNQMFCEFIAHPLFRHLGSDVFEGRPACFRAPLHSCHKMPRSCEELSHSTETYRNQPLKIGEISIEKHSFFGDMLVLGSIRVVS